MSLAQTLFLARVDAACTSFNSKSVGGRVALRNPFSSTVHAALGATGDKDRS